MFRLALTVNQCTLCGEDSPANRTSGIAAAEETAEEAAAADEQSDNAPRVSPAVTAADGESVKAPLSPCAADVCDDESNNEPLSLPAVASDESGKSPLRSTPSSTIDSSFGFKLPSQDQLDKFGRSVN